MAAAKANYWQRGETIDFFNNTNAKIEANTCLLYTSDAADEL